MSSDQIIYFPSKPHKVMHIARFAFVPELVDDEWMFRVATLPGRAMVTQHFFDAVEQHGLTGFCLKKIWSHEG